MEQWKDIPGYEGYYQASDNGRIRSMDRIVKARPDREYFQQGRILQTAPVKNGYLKVALSVDSVKKYFKVHQLIAKTFLPNPNQCINHKDGNKENNHVSNLEWCTHSENLKHSYLICGRVGPWLGKEQKRGKDSPNSKPVICLTTNERFYSIKEAAEKYNVFSTSIARVCKGRGNHAGGLKFKYA